jgi:hypothetical protein
LVCFLSAGSTVAQEDKKTGDLKPADPDTGESTVEETTLGLLPNPWSGGASSFLQPIGEMQLLWNAKKGDPGLDGKLKFGAWRHFGDFSDQRLGASGVTLADPASGGTPAMLRGDFGLYTVFEEALSRGWR